MITLFYYQIPPTFLSDGNGTGKNSRFYRVYLNNKNNSGVLSIQSEPVSVSLVYYRVDFYL